MVRSANERTWKFYVGLTLWLVGIIVLTFLDLGIIAFVGSILLCIWIFGLRDKFESEQTASAYSVFNKDGKAIIGGFTTEQLENQLRGSNSSSRNGTTSYSNNNSSNRSSSDNGVPVIASSSTARRKERISDDEKVRRRSAAAAAAEQRFKTSSNSNNDA